MASLEDIVTATKILSEDSDSIMGGSGSKSKEKWVGTSDVREDGVGCAAAPAAAAVSEGVLQSETVVESAFDGGNVVNCSSGDQEKEKSSVSYVTTSVSVNGSNSGDAVVGSERKNKDGEGSCADNGEDKCADYEQLNGSGRDGLYLDVDGDPKEEGDVEKLGIQDNGFLPGDFVWGKIKSHPWWPGQVYDPEDASEFAMKCKQEGRLLVAFFGDGSCSWCLPSQLIPFVENFVEMSTRSSSKSFLNAVQSAVDEVGRLVELQMTCKCIPEEKKDALARPTVVNAGLKAGVPRPEIDIHRLSIHTYESAELIEKVRELAKTATVCSALDIAVIRSWLSAFYGSKGRHQLPVYHDPLPIEGLEDKNKNFDEVSDDFSVPIEVPIMGPQDDDWLSSPTGGVVNSQGRSDNKIYHKRKQKSVAELMGEKKTIKPESRKRVTVKEGTDLEKPVSSQKRKKNNDEVEGGGGASSTGKTGRKRKAEVSESAETTDEKVQVADGVSEGPLSGKPKEINVAVVEKPIPKRNQKGTEAENEDDKSTKIAQVGDRTTEATGDKSCEQLPNGQAEGVDISVDTNPQTTENDKKMTFPASDVDAHVNELLSEIQLAALDPFYLSKKGSLDMVWAFVSALRSSTYLHGPDYKIFRKCTTAGKKKSLPSQPGNQQNDSTQKKAKSPEQSTPKAWKAEGTTDMSKSKKTTEISALPCLILEFTPGFTLPSKEDIVKLFSKFGSLNRKETKVVTDSHSVQIVYVKDSDAEAAFKSSLSQSPFGLENVNYRLQRSSAGSRSTRSHTKASPPLKRANEKRNSSHPSDDLISDVSIIRQKLEIMTAILENYHSKFSPKDKSSLKDEMKHLMEEVETISEKVRVMAENTST
ncbi:hypothetical protein Sango_0065800 [Sesamum angolense]|uniref:PWWP domain-containing protein n=1 Tax=Sesamum angolense TaxID=2727404 RepID=A0AAE1XDV2_9LAMI|nr:hypothetical protein Sango_0065800 [Sesamum angolense]